MCDVGDYTKFDCMDEIYEECESCESEICGMCLKGIMNGFVKLTLFSIMLMTGLIFAREKAEKKTDVGIINDGKEKLLPQILDIYERIHNS